MNELVGYRSRVITESGMFLAPSNPQFLHQENHMQFVNVDRNQLLKKLEENRTKHIEEYTEAKAGYLEAVIKRMKENLRKAVKTGVVEHTIMLTIPTSHESDYDTAIAMMEYSVDDQIKLMHNEFESYVLDKWTWSAQFSGATSMYSSKVSKQ
jgi:hypothetical protein